LPRIVLVFTMFLAVAFGCVAFWHSGRDASGQTTTTVAVGDNFFCASSFSFGVCDTNITAGDTVMWQWVGSAQHSVTQCDQTFTTCPTLGGFDSGFMASGSFSQTFNTPGVFYYRCNNHTTQMRGRINVAQQATPTATAGPTTTAGPTPSPGVASSPRPAPSGTRPRAGAASRGRRVWSGRAPRSASRPRPSRRSPLRAAQSSGRCTGGPTYRRRR